MRQPDRFAAEGVTMERRVRVVDDDLGIVEHRQIEVDAHTLRVTREDGRVWLALGPYSDVVRPQVELTDEQRQWLSKELGETMSDTTDSPRAVEDMHPATRAILLHFEYEHLPLALRRWSEPFHDLAHTLAGSLEGAELTTALRKLLEAKDCAVRAAIEGREGT